VLNCVNALVHEHLPVNNLKAKSDPLPRAAKVLHPTISVPRVEFENGDKKSVSQDKHLYPTSR
jgi:hypothetical protein